jgi:hypothetical protein
LLDADLPRFDRLMLTSTDSARESRGKNFLLFKGDEPDSWRWAVTLDDQTTKSGEAKSSAAALTQVVLLIDQAVSKSKA